MDTNNQKNILLIRNAAPDDFGGAETYQISLGSILLKNGFKPLITTRSDKLLRYSKEHGINTIRGWWWKKQNWNGLNTLFIPVYLLWQIALTIWYILLIRRISPVALHIQSRDDFIAATIAGKLTKTPTVWTDHMDLRYIFENISKPFKNIPGKIVFWAAKYADSIILISQNEMNLVTSHFKTRGALAEKIQLVTNGVIDTLPSMQRRSTQDNTIHFCIASRIVKNKGIGEVIDAFKKLLQDDTATVTYTLDIYGNGAGLHQFKERAADTPQIQFHGHTNNSTQAILDSDIFILPSYQEGFSIALLEATMLGKAIIASNVDSNPEIIHHNITGLLVPAKDPVSLAKAMKRLSTDTKLRQKIEKNSRANYIKNYQLDAIVTKQIIPLYNKQS